MQSTDLMMEGFNLMLMGMGFVFAFLTLLVIATTLMSKIILRFSKPEPLATPNQRGAASLIKGQSPDLIAAISAAIHLHRQRK
ncbi:MAG: OadG family protein [Pseudomonadaceae bacterium]|nr:OadG family protein [Pseudomonadaceae bacterium]